MTQLRHRPRARAIALRAEDARQAFLRRAFLAVTGGIIAAAGLAVALHGVGM